MIPRLDAALISAGDAGTLDALRTAAEQTGFATVHNTALTPARVRQVLSVYAAFFALPMDEKRKVDMAVSGANRGWGASGSEQVDPGANPDYKQVFDCGYKVPPGDPVADLGLAVYAPNIWPERPEGFRETIQRYYGDALTVSLDLLRGIARAIGAQPDYFDDKFTRPMALLRGNHYPARPDWAGDKDFGIGAHTDYGCLTLLATDGKPGLEVRGRAGDWVPLSAPPGEFIINFGEMLEMWTDGRVKATPHRVVGGSDERLSIPLFFNPDHDTNVAPMGSGKVIPAGQHLARRFEETYLHLRKG